MLPAETDGVLAWATIALAIATFVLAWATISMARNARKELGLMKEQIEVTREQVRARLELRDPRWPNPGELPPATVEYVGGLEAAGDVWVWFRCQDGRRFAKAANTPSPSRTAQQTITIDELLDSLKPTWDRYFGSIEAEH